MYLIINEDYTLQKSKILTGEIRAMARAGEISVVNCKKMEGLNTPAFINSLGEWSEISDYIRE